MKSAICDAPKAGCWTRCNWRSYPEASDVPIETAWRVKEEQTGKPLIVFLDQVEELYTRPIADIARRVGPTC